MASKISARVQRLGPPPAFCSHGRDAHRDSGLGQGPDAAAGADCPCMRDGERGARSGPDERMVGSSAAQAGAAAEDGLSSQAV
jgi:hypothetical protein